MNIVLLNLTSPNFLMSKLLRPCKTMAITYFLIPVYSYTQLLQWNILSHGSEFAMLGSCVWRKSHLLPCRISLGAHICRSTTLYRGRGTPRQRVVIKKSWICYCQIPICTPEWRSRVVWWGQLFGGVRSTPQEQYFSVTQQIWADLSRPLRSDQIWADHSDLTRSDHSEWIWPNSDHFYHFWC